MAYEEAEEPPSMFLIILKYFMKFSKVYNSYVRT